MAMTKSTPTAEFVARYNKAVKALDRKGVSFAALDRVCGFKNRKSTRDALGLLSRHNGYGIIAEGDTVQLK